MRINVIPIAVALGVTVVFLIKALGPGGHTYNLLPYMIHESFNKGGEGETTFIQIFDAITGIFIFFLVYWVMTLILKKYPH
jgi:hypothetical protein